ncbi:hypothetical protein G6F65_020564 [Rhizopus arrhizus]|nr:hypothetical protein G6F65_020564 [Rhizopus arrhizus]
MAARGARRDPGRGDPGTGEVGHRRLPGQLPVLPEAVWHGRLRADPAAVDLPVLGGRAAGRVVVLVDGCLPLPAGGAAPAAGLRVLRPAAPARSLPPCALEGQGPGR